MRPLCLERLGPETGPRWAAALRVGRPVHWTGPIPDGWHPAELGPLVERGPPAVEAWRAPVGTSGSRPAARPRVTVVVPTHQRVPWGVAMLRRQTWPTDVLVVSNNGGPTHVPGARVWQTHWDGHGGTRRRALAQVDTPLVLVMSDDAVPRGFGFVEALATHLLDSGADAVVARQVPWPTAPLRVRQRLRTWTPPSPGPMPHADHVATLYRTETLRRLATTDVPIAEDLAWTTGCDVHRVPGAPVLHSHAPSPVALFRRRAAEHHVRRELGHSCPVPGLRAAVRAAPGVVQAASSPHDAMCRLAELVGMGWGAHRARRLG